MKKWFHSVRAAFARKGFLMSVLLVFASLFVSLVVNFYAGQYAKEEASNPVTDVILSNIPVFNVDGAFVYGPVVFWTLVFTLIVLEPKRIPFVLKSVVLLMMVRSLFVSLTHIGPYPTHLYVHSSLFTYFTAGSDLFFSGHTAFPYLMSLIYWQQKQLRYFFMALSLFFGVIVLLAHVHYTIDVLAAFFITYTTFHIARTFFKKDQDLFLSTL